MHKSFLFVLLFQFIILEYVYAQDFEVSPVQVNFNAEPGESQSRHISIKNHSNKTTGFNFIVSDFSPTDNGKKRFLPANSVKNSIANWITINPSYLEIKPNEEMNVNLILQAPSEDFSSKWGIISVSPTKERTSFDVDKGLGAGVFVSAQIVVTIYQSPPGVGVNMIKISNLVESTKEKDTLRNFTATVENQGDKISLCKVYLIAANLSTADENIYPPLTIEVFPQMTRTVSLQLPNGLKAGKYALSAIIDYGSKSTLEGTQILIEVK